MPAGSLFFYKQLIILVTGHFFVIGTFCGLVSSILLILSMLSGGAITLGKPWSNLGIQKPYGGPKNHENNW